IEFLLRSILWLGSTRSFDFVSASHSRSGNSAQDDRQVSCYADFSAAGVFANRISNTSSPAPTTIALSATLNAGHWYDPRYTRRKSTTRPLSRRSHKLPNAPPRIKDNPTPVAVIV